MSLCQTKRKNGIAWLSNQNNTTKNTISVIIHGTPKKRSGYTYIHIGDTHLGILSNSWGTVHLPSVHHTWNTQISASQDLQLSKRFLMEIEGRICTSVHPHPNQLSQTTLKWTTVTVIANPKQSDLEKFQQETRSETKIWKITVTQPYLHEFD